MKRKVANDTIGSHTKWEWKLKLESWKFKCFWCNVVMKKHEAQKDHLIPICRGGSDFIENIVPACKPCNQRKGGRTAQEYLDFMSRQCTA